ncbi:MAG: hypothetical protein EAZ53_03075 [Bacteroidetes bacterium]|nr:MAG: hypothetical protein EAZ53_03075 [Bacteroidota bacterium]
MKKNTLLLLLYTFATYAQQVPNVKNSWFGNSTPLTATFTPQGMDDMCVGKDGTCYTNVPWEEGGANFSEFKNGNVNHGDASHGWGAGGGMAAASNLNYVYWSMVMGNEGGGLSGTGGWIDRCPVGNKTWIGVTRRQKSNVKLGATFSGGKGWPLNSMLVVEELDNSTNYGGEVNITGLYANENELFVSIELFNKVKVYDATTMAFKREFAVPQPRQLAMDSWGKLWIAQGFDATIINRYDPTNGALLPEAINLPSGSFVGDFCIDRNDRMLIGDVGRREQVLIYTTINTYPRETSTFGALYGIHSGVSGRNAPLKFQQIRGIGTDDNDNIYVGNTQWHTGGQGTMVEKYNAVGVLGWKSYCVLFVDACGLDAQTNGNDAYGKVEHFEIDYSKPLGQETEYVAYTIDRYKYPADPRLWQSMANVQVINFKGKKFLVMMDMTGRLIALFRFNKATDGEIAIPCIVWGERVNKNYPGSIDKTWIWRDTDGDGQMEAGEYTQQDSCFIDGGRGTYFDTNGDIWQAGWQNLLVNKCLGLDANGIPFYNGARTAIPAPAPLWDVKRAYYDPALDRMYLSGRNTTDQNDPPRFGQFDWMTMGRSLVRYDNWSTGNRTAHSELRLPFSNNGGVADPISFSVCNEYIFVCFVGGDNVIPRQQINIYRVIDNSYVGFIRPYWGGEGLFDMNQSINVQLRKNGEYVIVAEENGRNKNILYRWSQMVLL